MSKGVLNLDLDLEYGTTTGQYLLEYGVGKFRATVLSARVRAAGTV